MPEVKPPSNRIIVTVRGKPPVLPDSVTRGLEDLGRKVTESITSSPSWRASMEQLRKVAASHVATILPPSSKLMKFPQLASNVDLHQPKLNALRPKRAVIAQRPEPSRYRSGADDGHPGNFI